MKQAMLLAMSIALIGTNAMFSWRWYDWMNHGIDRPIGADSYALLITLIAALLLSISLAIAIIKKKKPKILTAIASPILIIDTLVVFLIG